MNRTKLGAYLTAGLTLVYIALFANLGIIGLASSELVAKLIGALILVFPIVGIWLVFAEFRFGSAIEKLAARVERTGNWPEFDFDYRPSGRPTKASADRVFELQKQKTEANPHDFQSWFNLGLAYDAAGDRRRARAAMRTALQLAKTSPE